ncbi:NAD-dependent epimerase/dehydratase family protein [Desertivirga arenae]|uniref:NAD-dependent epimerase/dehydratase family protein n=1 Tax=Desertivirga arenae TaxID=2810309 RepID=UPI001A96984A|nr:NAD-dependent epimerase/dehydratase family protein [Pedobacter sp. SYSU D00823]
MKILVTGGAGFIGYNILSYLNDHYPSFSLIAFDNLKRLGSESNVAKLKLKGVTFIHGDIRNAIELKLVGQVDFVVHCASDASVLSGITSSSDVIIQNNLLGSINIFEFAAKQKAAVIFFSTNRVYGCSLLNNLKYSELDTRFSLSSEQVIPGVSEFGIAEDFPVYSEKTFYGATKYCSEVLLQEYAAFAGLKYVINRFGVVAGRGQFGMQDQGVVSFWLKQHLMNGNLGYFGYGGKGKQVRDALHVLDLCRVIDLQISNFSIINGETFNIGGGKENSFSLKELTELCKALTGNSPFIESVIDNRVGDIPIYFTDNRKVENKLRWTPSFTVNQILKDLYDWYQNS